MDDIRAAFPLAADATVTLLRDPKLAAAWGRPSALPEFTVRGVAGHLSAQVLLVARLVASPTPADEPIPLLDHYARGTWVGAGLDEEVNARVRRQGESISEIGPQALAERVEKTVAELRVALPDEPADRVVHLPWAGWSLALDDFLVTRMMEITVHSDDLAVSVGVPTPVLPDVVLDPVLDLLRRLAERRHGATALVRAFSRAERAPATVAAF